MKLIMEQWRDFIVEDKKQEIDNLSFGDLKHKGAKDRLAEEPKIIDIKLSDIPITKYPENSSSEVKKELLAVMSAMKDQKDISKEEFKKRDLKYKEMLTDYMKDNNLDYDEKKLERIRNDVAILTLGLKMRYNRPRPEQLGPMLGYDIKSMKTETDDTPSYPSGHTAQAWTMAYYLADLHPDHKDALFDMAQKVEDSRIIRGAHYPSDNIEAKNIAQKYYFPNIKE